jgi:hypothetical protein
MAANTPSIDFLADCDAATGRRILTEIEMLANAASSDHSGGCSAALFRVRERYADLWVRGLTDVKKAIASKRRWGEIGALLDDASGQGR